MIGVRTAAGASAALRFLEGAASSGSSAAGLAAPFLGLLSLGGLALAGALLSAAWAFKRVRRVDLPASMPALTPRVWGTSSLNCSAAAPLHVKNTVRRLEKGKKGAKRGRWKDERAEVAWREESERRGETLGLGSSLRKSKAAAPMRFSHLPRMRFNLHHWTITTASRARATARWPHK